MQDARNGVTLALWVGSLIGSLSMALGAWVATSIEKPWWVPLPSLLALYALEIAVAVWRWRRTRTR